jgi:hypothetical protein
MTASPFGQRDTVTVPGVGAVTARRLTEDDLTEARTAGWLRDYGGVVVETDDPGVLADCLRRNSDPTYPHYDRATLVRLARIDASGWTPDQVEHAAAAVFALARNGSAD